MIILIIKVSRKMTFFLSFINQEEFVSNVLVLTFL
uniref:Uncharacterized protein n=1 Tax=Rhizophora mucronata TaxID=61149 RepID=A0A2P2K3F0_RHIMU